MLNWTFDRAGASGQRKGGKSGDQIVGTKLGTLTREAIQNCRDQWLQNGQPVRVRFSIITLSGQRKKGFLSALNWTDLSNHIQGAVEFGKTSPLARQLQKAKERIEGDDILLLRIDDFNTNGLIGGEDELDQNFQNLCKNEFVTPERGGRGGSYGIGKQVYHRFSSISSVLYSSYVDGLVDGKPKQGLRLFGRAQLTSHSMALDDFAPDGWFGARKKIPAGERAESVWDEVALCDTLQIGRDKGDGSGTSILIMGFFDAESGSNDTPVPLKVAERIQAEAEKWFWPSMSGSAPSVSVEVRVVKDGTVLHTLTADPQQNWGHFIRANASPVTGNKAEKTQEVAEKGLTFRVPARTEDPTHSVFDADVTLRITREAEVAKDKLEELGNIALVRGFGMVVKYLRPRNRPLTSEPFCGVLKAGTAVDDTMLSEHAEEFFRASEPPLHDEWRHDTDSVRENYSMGAGAAYESLWAELSQSVVELCGLPQPTDDKGPKLLSKLLPFGDDQGPPRRKTIIVKDVEACLTSAGWEVQGSILNLKPGPQAWDASLLFYLRGEKGKGDGLRFSKLVPTSGTVTDMGPRAVINIPASKKAIEFTGILETAGLSISDLRRIKLAYEQ